MSMSHFIEVENDIIKLKQYPAIEKISELANRINKKGVDPGYDSPEMKWIFQNLTVANQSTYLDFFYHYLK